jgi:hypothetical protein
MTHLMPGVIFAGRSGDSSSTQMATVADGDSLATWRRAGLDRYFYLAMAVLIAAVVVYGFSRTIFENLIHPADPRPRVLYVHAVVFASWVVLLNLQSALIRTRNVQLHRKIGSAAIALGMAIPAVGVATGIAMAEFNTRHGSTDEAQFLIVPIFDMIAFSIVFGLAVWWRRKPEFHRRLMLIAACGLTVAAFNRFPIVPEHWGYAGVDILILLGVGRDWIVDQRVHPVYVYALPAMVLGQLATTYIQLTSFPYWMAIARSLIG